MLSVIPELILEVGLKEGEKAAANFAAKVATVVGSGALAIGVNHLLEKQRVPLNKIPKEERERNSDGRQIRNLVVTGTFSALGITGYKLLSEAIEASDIII